VYNVCNPYNSQGFDSIHNTRPATTVSTSPSGTPILVSTPLDCCALCANAENCLFYHFQYKNRKIPAQGVTCKYVLATDQLVTAGDNNAPDHCPLGIDYSSPSYLYSPQPIYSYGNPGDAPFNYSSQAWGYGPCDSQSANTFESDQGLFYPPQ
jgi:hypothetical protein